VWILICYLLLRKARLALPWHDKGGKTAIQVSREHHTPTREAWLTYDAPHVKVNEFSISI
jgi:hypothetical protein